MAKVITLDGLKTGTVDAEFRGCRRTVEVHSPTTRQRYLVCEDDLTKIQEKPNGPVLAQGKRGRGRPRGTTVKAGARRPKVTHCREVKLVRQKSGRLVCMCATKGNSQLLPMRRCKREKE